MQFIASPCDSHVFSVCTVNGFTCICFLYAISCIFEFLVCQLLMSVFDGIQSIIRYWDTRQSNPVHTQQLPDRCYALTVRHPLMVVGTADRNLIVFNLQNPQVMFSYSVIANRKKIIEGSLSIWSFQL